MLSKFLLSLNKALSFIFCFLFISSKQHNDEKELHRLVFDFLKQQKSYQNIIKCDGIEERISEFVEEITISQPTLFNNAKFEDVKFLVFSVNCHEAEVETIEVIILFLEYLWRYNLNDFNRMKMGIRTMFQHHNIGFCHTGNSKVFFHFYNASPKNGCL